MIQIDFQRLKYRCILRLWKRKAYGDRITWFGSMNVCGGKELE